MARLRSLAILVVALVPILTAAVARAADFVVDSTVDAIDAMPGDGICAADGGACTVRAAVIESNQLAGADTISMPAGLYVLTIGGAGEYDGLAGDLNVLGDLSIRGAGLGLTVLDGAGLDNVLHVVPVFYDELPPPQFDASDLTITGGSPAGVSIGEAYNLPHANVSISDCSIEGNSGAGISGYGTTDVTLLRSAIRNNSGPAIGYFGNYLGQPLIAVDHCQISDNGPNGGRAISVNAATLRLRNSVVENNRIAGVGAGDCSIVIEDSWIRGNSGAGVNFGEAGVEVRRTTIEANSGGGLASTYFSNNLIVSDSAIVRNSGRGGVSADDNSSVDIEGSTISENSGSWAGGIHADGYLVRVRNSTIVYNVGDRVGGIGFSSYGVIDIAGTLLAGNTSPAGSSDCGQFFGDPRNISSSGGNLVGDRIGCTFDALPSDLVGTHSSPINPLIAPLAMNGGPTLTHALLPGSPAIDAGGTACLPTDQRGVARPLDGNGNGLWACDIGAYETCPLVGDDANDNGIPDACEDLLDSDGDRVSDALDNCPATVNTDQRDDDVDGVGNECDNCVEVPNPRPSAGWLGSNGWAVLTGGQRDDDFDGFGNKCDAKFPGSLGVVVGGGDLLQFRASNGRAIGGADCGSGLSLPCAIFDLNEDGKPSIGALDLVRFRALSGWAPGPKCALCPLACEAGTLRSCDP